MRKDSQYFANLQKTLQGLRATPVFANLSDAEFRLVADLLTPQKIARTKFVISLAAQSELDLYVLRQGRASLRKPDKKYVDDVQKVFQPGDMMNLDAFVAGKDSNETIEALTDLEVWAISHDAFAALLVAQPELKSKLGTLKDVTPFWANQARYAFVPEKGEIVAIVRRKHGYVLLVKLIPVALMLLMGVLLWRLPVFMPETTRFATPIVAGIWFFITLLFGAWQVNDWSDDFYAVTNRRVIHRERVLFFSNRQAEVPIGQISSIIASRTNILANTFLFQQMGDVIIETANSYHPIVFANIDKPEEVSDMIRKQVDQAKITGKATERDVIRGILRAQMSIVEKPANTPKSVKVKVVGYGAPAEEPEPKPKPLPFIVGHFLLPYARVKDDKGNITYRRHPVQLLQTAGPPLLALLVYAALLLAGWRLGIFAQVAIATSGAWPLRLILIGLVATTLLVLVIWFIFRYEDWRNDLFLLTKSKIFEIDRSPFGLSGIQQNVTSLDKVKNITSNQKGFIDWLFNMGDVTIDTGSEKNLVFERIKDPRQIQRDIADYLAQIKIDEKAAEVAKNNENMANWISIYNEMLNLPYDRNSFKSEK